MITWKHKAPPKRIPGAEKRLGEEAITTGMEPSPVVGGHVWPIPGTVLSRKGKLKHCQAQSCIHNATYRPGQPHTYSVCYNGQSIQSQLGVVHPVSLPQYCRRTKYATCCPNANFQQNALLHFALLLDASLGHFCNRPFRSPNTK
uniref:Uncharacterized protein n=1 Tax=Solanum tuberosum TaxID=4113 RepID=M1AJT1_SOLTU